MTVLIQQAAVLMRVQGGGRRGYQRFGMPASGPMDWWAFRAANRLVGNPPDTAGVELGFSGAEFHFEQDTCLAACGAGFRLFVNQRELPLWMAVAVRAGESVHLEKIAGGNWAYLALTGGIQSAAWLGSRSAYPAAGLGVLLAAGDRLLLAPPASDTALIPGRALPKSAQPSYGAAAALRVMPGPHLEMFVRHSWEIFLGGAYQVSPRSDRMGYRLVGPQLAHQDGPDLVSQGMPLGAIQVPGDGQPIVMMADHPTTGGYACIATLARADLPLLAQVEPGLGAVRFTAVALADAQQALQEALERIDSTDMLQEDEWTGV